MLGSGLTLTSALNAADTTGVDTWGTEIEFIDAPALLNLDSLESSTDIRAFYEGTVTLQSDLGVYTAIAPGSTTPGTITAGTTFNSYLLHWDPENPVGTPNGVIKTFTDAFITFDTEVLGFLGSPTELDDSDFLNATTDFGNISGYEGRSAGFGTNNDAFTVGAGVHGDNYEPGKTFVVSKLSINGSNVDQIRVFTAAVPEPTTVMGLILGLGFVGYRTIRRRKAGASAAA